MKNPAPLLAAVALGLAAALAPLARAADSVPLPQFRSVLIDGQSRLFSLADATGSGRWLALGETFDGWKLQSFDAAKQTLVLARDGQTRELSLATASIAQGENRMASVADADALLQKMRFEEMIRKSVEAQQSAMAKSMGSMLGKNASDEDRAKFGEFQQRIMQVMLDEMDLPGMRQDVAKIYAETFTASELKAQADFYATPAGEAMIDKQPLMQQRMTELMMPRMMKAMPKIGAMSREFAAEQKAAKDAAAKPAATPAPAAN